MSGIDRIFWRAVTKADFFNVERGPHTGPASGGGQLYFSISFGDHLDHGDLGDFLGVEPPDAVRTTRPAQTINVAAIDDPGVLGMLEFRARYRPPQTGDRYYIARQNRRRDSSERHPAWMPERGFPEAPDDVYGPDDPAIPDLSRLKIYILRDVDGGYHAGFANSSARPPGLPAAVDELFRLNELGAPNALIHLDPALITVEAWRDALRGAGERSPEGVPSSPEIEDASDAIARAAGARPRGQRFRQSAEERRAIEAHSMAVATSELKAQGWNVEDVSTSRSYDLHCTRGTERLHVEVKGTTGDGTAVLLTPNEVVLARDRYPATALFIVSEIDLSVGPDDSTLASGGKLEILTPWDPDAAGELRPLGFHYVLGDQG